jgi:hypothetical protein
VRGKFTSLSIQKCSCPIYWGSAFVFARLGKPTEAISGDMRLPRTFQVLAMTESEVPDESVPDLIRDPKIW